LRLFLASVSPRRRDLLRQIGLDPITCPQSIPERQLPGEAPAAMVQRLAREKADSALADPRLTAQAGVVLAADTCVVLDGDVLGKPDDDAQARAMLRRLSGRTHQVLTGVRLARTDGPHRVEAVTASQVRFRVLPAAAIESYVATGEPRDKAGAYGIQGRGALFCAAIEGSWSNVVGLPLEPLAGWMERLGVSLEALIRWDAAAETDPT